MGKKHFAEEQIAYALRQQEAGTAVAELTRKLGISEHTFDRWKKTIAGLGGRATQRFLHSFHRPVS